MRLFETQSLLVRTVNLKDMENILTIYQKEKNMKFISSGKYDWTMEELHDKYKKANQDYSIGLGIYVVIDRSSGKIIGEAGLFNSFENKDIIELGYILDYEFWGKGLGKELCKGLIEYCSDTLRAKKIVARMYAENVSSVKLSESVGMVQIKTGKTENGDIFYQYELDFS